MNTKYISIKTILLAALVLVSVVSCKKDFLEIKPKKKVIASKYEDYNLFLNNYDLFNMSTTDAQISMGDELVALSSYFDGAEHRERNLFSWSDTIYRESEDSKETLPLMKALFIYNTIINEVLDAEGGREEDRKSLQAEALAGRAWTYFQLINYYGKPYDAATASSDPGFPIIDAADINGSNFTRASVQDVYDFIVSDLTTAIPNFTSNGIWHRMRMSKGAAQGLLAKVYIFMGKYQEALPLLESAFVNLAESSVVVGLYDYNVSIPTSAPLAPNDEENLYMKQFSNQFTGSSAKLMLSPEAEALYDATDLRLGLYTSYTYGSQTLLKKTRYYTTQYGVRLADLYLLLAETKARLNNLPGAVSDLEYFREHRMPAENAVVPEAIASNKTALLQFIMEERVREFAMTGFRWFDMRRLSVDPLFTTPTYIHKVISSTTGEVERTFTLDAPNRFTLKIPPKILAENPNMQDNL